MRFLSLMALLGTCGALSGCAGGNALDAVNALNQPCRTTNTSVDCSTPSATTGTSSSGQSTSGTGTTPSTPTTPVNTNVGNTVSAQVGDTAITLENAKLTSSTSKLAVTKMTQVADVKATPTQPYVPGTAKFEINTNTSTNASWPIAKTMTEYEAGSCAYDGGVDMNNRGYCKGGTGGHGLGGTYHEYRALSGSTGVDEELQVWNWNNSYGLQYRDVTGSGGTAPIHQAWSYGGTYTPAAVVDGMKTAGAKAAYNGKFGAVAVSSNWLDQKSSTMTLSANNTWSVTGDAKIDADFGAGTVSGKLHPTTWVGEQTMNGASGEADAFDASISPDNHKGFMDVDIGIDGKIGTSTVATDHANTISGTAAFDPTSGFITNQTTSIANGAFFGAGANEVAGVFNADGTAPGPIGGIRPIQQDKRGLLNMSGVFHGQ